MIFCPKINIKVSYKLVVSVSLVIARHAQSTQNNKLSAISKKGMDEVDFVHADKHQTILQVDIIYLGGHYQACPNYPKSQGCNIFAISQIRRD